MKVYKNISGLEFVVIDKLPNRQVLVRFLGTGSVVKADGRNLSAGKVADPFHKSRLGIGYMGNFSKTAFHKQAYQLWSNMLKRCYDENDARGYFGTGVGVDPRWHSFENFVNDLPHLSSFNGWKSGEGYDLDKDFRGDGKTYSRETCCFLPRSVNRAAGKGGKTLLGGVWVTTKL